MPDLELHSRGPYSLAASTAFLEGFTPAAYTPRDDALRLAFVTDDAFVPGGAERVAGVILRAEGDRVVGEIAGDADPAVVRRQVERILSLDVDGSGFLAVGERDPVVGRLQARYPGLRPVLFLSPYEAAAWALIGNRIRITQAAKIKAEMARQLGTAVEIGGNVEHAFPAPSRLARLDAFPGLSGRKVDYLRALAAGAASGRLDAAALRAVSSEQALATLQEFLGIGPFGAGLILLRGAGAPDEVPASEPRLARAIATAYGLASPPSPAATEAIAERWRPYRTWVVLLLRTMLEEDTGEIAGRPPSRSP
jgi:DNA-3-methyladenine glycosylase II